MGNKKEGYGRKSPICNTSSSEMKVYLASEKVLNVHSIEMQIRYEAALTPMRFKAMGERIINHHKSYHQNIMR